MMHLININDWERSEVYRFFTSEPEIPPIGCVTVKLDCTKLYFAAKQRKESFFLHYLHILLEVINTTMPNFRYRLSDSSQEDVLLCDSVRAGITISKENHSFGFAQIPYEKDFQQFSEQAKQIMERAKAVPGMNADSGKDQIFVTVTPDLDFSSLVFTRSSVVDIPRFGFGKCVQTDNIWKMSLAIQYHHGFVDGYHLGQVVKNLQEMFDLRF